MANKGSRLRYVPETGPSAFSRSVNRSARRDQHFRIYSGRPIPGPAFGCSACYIVTEMSSLKELARGRSSALWRTCFASLTVSLALVIQVPAAAPASDKAPGQSQPADHEQADAAYQRGMKLLQEKLYAEALEQFRLVEQGAPRSPQGPAGEGIALTL